MGQPGVGIEMIPWSFWASMVHRASSEKAGREVRTQAIGPYRAGSRGSNPTPRRWTAGNYRRHLTAPPPLTTAPPLLT